MYNSLVQELTHARDHYRPYQEDDHIVEEVEEKDLRAITVLFAFQVRRDAAILWCRSNISATDLHS